MEKQAGVSEKQSMVRVSHGLQEMTLPMGCECLTRIGGGTVFTTRMLLFLLFQGCPNPLKVIYCLVQLVIIIIIIIVKLLFIKHLLWAGHCAKLSASIIFFSIIMTALILGLFVPI